MARFTREGWAERASLPASGNGLSLNFCYVVSARILQVGPI